MRCSPRGGASVVDSITSETSGEVKEFVGVTVGFFGNSGTADSLPRRRLTGAMGDDLMSRSDTESEASDDVAEVSGIEPEMSDGSSSISIFVG